MDFSTIKTHFCGRCKFTKNSNIRHILSGIQVNNEKTSIEFPGLEKLKMWSHLKNVDRLQRSIGSLGGGNHFIELNKDEYGGLYLVIHSGSRNLGQQVCKHYQSLAIESCNKKTKEMKEEINSTIDKLKSENRQTEISQEIKNIHKKYNEIEKTPDDLCFLTGKQKDDYLYDMEICQEYAKANRFEIAWRIRKFMKEKFNLETIRMFHTIHNYIDFRDNIIRKGAISCNKGEEVIIPLNMRDGSILAIGKGNED